MTGIQRVASLGVTCLVLSGVSLQAQLLSGPGPGSGSSSDSGAGSAKRAIAPRPVKKGPLTIQDKVAIAERLMRQGKWERAAEVIEDIQKEAPGMEGADLTLSTCYIKLERYDDAFALLSPILQKLPEHPFVLNNTAWVRLQSKTPGVHDPEIAVILARRAVLASPSRANIWGTLAEGYLALSEPKVQKAMDAASVGLTLSRLDMNADSLEFEDLIQRAERLGGKRPDAPTAGASDASDSE